MSQMLNTASFLPALTRLAADRRGVTAIVTGIALTVIVGFAGLAIDVAYWLNATRTMQAAAAQAAYSAASAAGTSGCTSTAAVPQAIAIATARGYGPSGTPATVNNVTTLTDSKTTLTVTCTPSNSQFTVKIDQKQPMWFASLFLAEKPTASASATAQLAGKASDLCVLALDGTNPTEGHIGSDANAFYATGSTDINIGCGIAVDSTSPSSLGAGSNAASITATDIYLMGDSQASSNGFTPNITATGCSDCDPVIPPGTILKNQTIPVADPYAGRAVPAHNCGTSTAVTVTNTLSPSMGNGSPTSSTQGTFCGGLHLSGTVTVNCGTYVIAGGALQINSTARVTQSSSCSTGVTFILTNSNSGANDYATLTYNGNPASRLILTAPTTGPYGGMVFFQDRAAPNPNTSSGNAGNTTCGSGAAQNSISGSADQALTGAIYFPSQALCFAGGSSSNGDNKCTQLIAYNLAFVGHSELKSECEGVGITPISVMTPQLIR